jgi:hypothetical protein
MNNAIKLLVASSLSAAIIGCSKNETTTPTTPGKPVISNLIYSPVTITIDPATPTIYVYGTIDFTNADGGVAQMRVTTSTGLDLIVAVPANSESKGTLSGSFEFMSDMKAGVITFDTWIVDNKGNSSNKLPGTIQLTIDDSGTRWKVASQAYSLHKVIWANNKYVSVGQSGTILTSTNGVSWTQKTAGTTASLYAVTWTGSQYIAVGENNTILASADGHTWLNRSAVTPGTSLYSIAFSGTNYVAAGVDNTTSRLVILNSFDGINWTRNNYNPINTTINSIKWTGTQYVAVGKSSGPLVLTSPDGLDWTTRNNPLENYGEFTDVTSNGSIYAAIGYSVTATSTDAVTWTIKSGNSWGGTGITWSGSRFMASSITGIYTSTDGASWTKCFDTPYPTRSVTWSGLQYAAVGSISPIILISP